MEQPRYAVKGAAAIETPALLYYKDIIVENTQRAIKMAGGAKRLWPHVKSHKMEEMIRLQQGMGIERFKCATIAEAEMLARCGAQHILLAYPLVGPNIQRFLALSAAYPASAFYAIGDDFSQLQLLSEQSNLRGVQTCALLDLNMGMNRTGVPMDEAGALYRRCAALPGLLMAGLHAYDGHSNQPDPVLRAQNAKASVEAVHALRHALRAEGLACELLVAGGTPSFPIHAAYDECYLSPGTIFLTDARYAQDFTDLEMEPAAALMTRVVSHPAEGLFTIDLGTKGISTDMPGRGVLLGMPGATALFQSEEHWVYRVEEGGAVPPIGEVLYVIPMHICPTTALYAYANIVEGGKVVGRWAVTARDRNIGW